MPEKHVTIYASYAYQREGEWRIPLRVWVHEKPDLIRRTLGKAAREALEELTDIDELDDAEKNRFEFRSEGFLADSKSGEKVVVVFDGDGTDTRYRITDTSGNDNTNFNGLIEGTLTLSDSTVNALLAERSDRWVGLRVVSANHQGHGWVRFIENEGISVVSDIDDTIKITEIPKGKAVVLRNTFFEAFRAVPCMVARYQNYDANVSFHYVSGGPWQLYAPLVRFLESSTFPRGSFHMKSVGTNPFASETYEDIWKLIANGSTTATKEQKTAQITQLFGRFPNRRFILFGDSGEGDPEIYRNIQEEFSDQIEAIYIRDVGGDHSDETSRLEGFQVLAADDC